MEDSTLFNLSLSSPESKSEDQSPHMRYNHLIIFGARGVEFFLILTQIYL